MKRLFILFFLPFLPLLSLVSDGSIINETTPTKETVPVSAPPSSDGFEWVDLGLSVMWASCNLGSSSPSDYGGFAAWGEVESKDEYTWKNYRYRLSGDSDETIKFSKYNTKSQFGTIDRKTRLDPSDDAANVIVGKRWRLPTEAEWEELLTQCDWQWGRAFGKSYIRVFSYKTKQAIILPAQGYCKDNLLHGQGEMGLYWSSSTDAVNPREAFAIAFNKERKGRGTHARYYGAALRPVYDPVTTKGSISFSSNPAGAAIWLEDDTGKTTPAVIDNLTPTTYNYRLHYDGYETVEGKITVSPGQRTTVSQNLTPSSPEQTDPSKGSIKITSEPSGATIKKGVYPLGTGKYTPAVLHNVEPGEITIRLVHKGYAEKSFKVLVEAGKTVDVSIKLEPNSPAETGKPSPATVSPTSSDNSSKASAQMTPPSLGKISFTSEPSGARIWINGKWTFKRTPATLEDIESGEYEYELELKDYEKARGRVTVTPNQTTAISRTLEIEKKKPQKIQSGMPSADKEAFQATKSINGHPAVDMGLSIMWATMNVGASSPYDYGDYYAWGEIAPKEEYTETSYTYHDSPGTLPASNDVVTANWGGKWRMPTDVEWMELRTKCNWTRIELDGIIGYKVTSKVNGNSIFLPAAGYRRKAYYNGVGSYGSYWSSSLSTDNLLKAWAWDFNSSGVINRIDSYRYWGQSVRPVSN